MGDFSLNYSNSTKGMIFFNYGKQIVNFKPFVDSFSYSYSNLFDTDGEANIYNTTPTVKTFKESKFNVTFNVLAFDVAEAIENHKKFQKLVRMITPAGAENTGVAKYVYVKFSNLISSKGQIGKDNMSVALLRSQGFNGIISSINYQPDMDLGFFEFDGLIFAKAFKITFDLSAVAKPNKADVPMFRSGLGYGRKYSSFVPSDVGDDFVGPPAPAVTGGSGGGSGTGGAGDPDADVPF